MPYAVRKSGDKYKVVNKNTSKVYGTHDSKEKANRQLAALHIHTHESKSILKQDLIIECDGAITIVPEGSVILVDRYSAIGMEAPDQKTMCKGECEGTGYIPVFNPECQNKGSCYPSDATPLEPIILALWQAAEAENQCDDGWHFIECPDCNGKGKAEITNDALDYINEDSIEVPTRFGKSFQQELVRPIIKKDGFVAYRVKNGNKRSLSWIVLYNNDVIGTIFKSDSRFVHDNWIAQIVFDGDKPSHKLITKDTRPIVQNELDKLAGKVSKAYHNKDSDIVQ
jgi:hypothetical protein